MSRENFIREILADEEESLVLQMVKQYTSLDLTHFLTVLLQEKDRHASPNHLALRAKFDQIGVEAISRSEDGSRWRNTIHHAIQDERNTREFVRQIGAGYEPLFMEMLAFYAELYVEQGQAEYAKSLMRVSIAAAEATHQPLTAAISQYQFGMVLLKLNELAEATEQLERSLPAIANHYPSFVRQIESYLAFTYFNMGAMEKAHPFFLKLVKEADERTKPKLDLHLAETEYWMGNLASAQKYAERAESHLSSQSTEYPHLEQIRAQIERRMGNFDAAEIAISKAIAAYIERGDSLGHAESLNIRALIRNSQGKFNEVRPLLNQAQLALGALETGTEISLELNYGMEALRRGDDAMAEAAFRRGLELATRLEDDFGKALCLGNLGAVFLHAPRQDPTPFLLQALRLFTKLNRQAQRIEVLYNLGYREAMLGIAQKIQGFPQGVLAPLRRAKEYFEQGIQLAYEFGLRELLIQGYRNLAGTLSSLNWKQEALQTYIRAADGIEQIRLTLVQDEAGATFVDSFAWLYEEAVRLSTALERPALALWMVERFRSRHQIKNLARTELGGMGHASHRELYLQEQTILEQLHWQYAQLQRAHVSNAILGHKEQILQLEMQLNSIYANLDKEQIYREYLALRRGEPLDYPALLALFPNFDKREIPSAQEIPQPNAERFVLQGGSRIQCPNCSSDNLIGSTFCSICDARLPRSSSRTFAPEDETVQKRALADFLYNQALKLIFQAQLHEATEALQSALELADHPDYHYFLAWCTLGLQDPSLALVELEKIQTMQFQYRYPFYPLPISPPDFEGAIRSLRNDPSPANGKLVLEFLVAKFREYYSDVLQKGEELYA